MKCEDVHEALSETRVLGNAAARRAAMQHIAGCRSCRDARYAAQFLHAEKLAPIPGPTSGAFERAMAVAVRPPAARRGVPRRSLTGFWLGAAVGGGVAAAIALAWAILAEPRLQSRPAAAATPQVALAPNETRDISIAVDTPAALADVEIRVVLTGAIGLAGFEGQRELRWQTDLDAGSNRLTLPVVALGSRGGQLLVEVQHGERRRTFVVDVRAIGA